MKKKEICPSCGKSFVYLNRHKCKENTKQAIEYVKFKNCKIRKDEAKILEEIEKLTGEKFTVTQKIGFDKKLTFTHKNNRITGLTINKCGLKELPESITKLLSLEILWLDGNTISTIPDSLKNLTK